MSPLPGAATPPTNRPPTLRPGWHAKARARKPSSAANADVLMENRKGLAIDSQITQADGRAVPLLALEMVESLGVEAGHARCRQRLRQQELRQELRDHQVTPHIACKPTSIIDDRTTRHPGYAICQQKRADLSKKSSDCSRPSAGLRKTRHRGVTGGMRFRPCFPYNRSR